MPQHPHLLPIGHGPVTFAPDEAGGGPSFQPPGIPGAGGSTSGGSGPTFQKPAGAYTGLPAGTDPAQVDTGTYELSGWWRRVGAYVVDFLILLIPFFILMAIVVGALGLSIGFDSDGNPDDTATGAFVATTLVSVLVYAVLALVYAPFFMSRWNGATPGKRATGIRVVRADGLPITFGFAAIREVLVKQILFGILSAFTGLASLIDVLWPLWDSEHRALHDMIVKTRVVRA